MTCDLSLILKCYNEEVHLKKSLEEILQTLRQSRLSFEIIFVEDKSIDATAEILRKLLPEIPEAKAIFHEKNYGHGQSMADAAEIAEGKVIGFIDIDLEVSSVYVPTLAQEIISGRCQIATGYRHYPFQASINAVLRKILSLGYRWMFRTVLQIPLKDPETGYKFFDAVVLRKLLVVVKNPGWFWDTEIMSTAYLQGIIIAEIPCLFLRRSDKKTTIRVVSYSIRQLKELITFRKKLAQDRLERKPDESPRKSF